MSRPPSAPLPDNEDRRLEALRRYRILDTAPEQAYDDIAFLVATLCDAPMGVVTLVDEKRQWFKARLGLPLSETPREQSFCAYTILGKRPMIISDTSQDSRFADNPLVTGEPGIRFYAGAPLIDSQGFALGSLCVIDRQPRGLSQTQTRALEALSRQVMAHLEYRRAAADLAAALADVETLRQLLPICAHCKSIRNDQGYWDGVETYFARHARASFSHGICPDCMQKHFPEVASRDARPS